MSINYNTMSAGCMNRAAANFDELATEHDYSCIFIVPYNGVCYAFEEVEQLDSKSYTLSFSFEKGNWVFFHDYVPDMYFHTKEKLYSVKDNKIYRHNAGGPGKYYNETPKSFFIDMVFRSNEEMILNSVQWISEVLDNQKELEYSTITHITIWNNQQCTGKIALTDVLNILSYQRNKSKGEWSFNDFKDLLKTYGSTFLTDIFNNQDVITSQIDQNKPWFDQGLLQGNFFIVRLEFDNLSQKQVILHEASIQANPARL